MSDKLKFLFGSHCHQPVGNFDSVFEQATNDAYEPFFRELAGAGEITMSAHFSGPLLEWLEENRPGMLELLAELCESGRLEMMGGGFYEPVLAAIPEVDRRGQLAMMNSFISGHFGQQAAGAWMTERVWEPQVIGSLLATGLRYVVIDDYHFKCAGIKEEQLDGYYFTETDGQPLAVFPISEALRYTIPFEAPEKTIEILRHAYESGKRCVVMMDDGEKFGLWPGTKKLCYKEGWVRRFFDVLRENTDWLELSTPSRILKELPPQGTVYLPTASYYEMSEWSLPADMAGEFSNITHELQGNGQIERYRPFLRGGIWRNFFSKYPESNNMHKRAHSLSTRIRTLDEKTKGNSHSRSEIEIAQRELYRAQCNCAYWHGVFGGLYLPHLRDAVYRHILLAEKAADRVEYGEAPPKSPVWDDFNFDGIEEPMLRSKEINALFSPRYGGALYELDYRPLEFNLLNTLASRKEGYHAAMLESAPKNESGDDTPSIHDINRSVDDSMREALHYDWHNRYSFLDHCLPLETNLTAMAGGEFRELGDFVNQPYEAKEMQDSIILHRAGSLYMDGGSFPLAIEKRIRLDGSELNIDCCIVNSGDVALDFLFAPELNFSLLSGEDDEQCYVSPDTGLEKPRLRNRGVVKSCNVFGIDDRRRGFEIRLTADVEMSVWFFPAQTVSQSESGFELNYQSSVVIPHWRLSLASGEQQQLKLTLSVRSDSE